MRWLVAGMLAICVVGTGRAQDISGKGYAEDPVLVERVVWPVLIEPTKLSRGTGVCDRLGPDDLVLTEDGERRPVKALNGGPGGWSEGPAGRPALPSAQPAASRPLRRIHAILIDTSVSMKISDRLEHAKAAAIRYIEQLPADERVLVASFDDSLVLISPPTLNREGLVAAIEKTEPGNYTALWDALSELIRYLEVFPDQKTIVLLSDGEDSSSMSEGQSREILDRVGARPDLSIFPIGIDLHSHRDSDQFRGVLRRVASATGGQFFETNGGLGIDHAFERLRSHLDRRFYATYEPLPDEDAALARRSGLHQERKVRVIGARGVPCKVESAGPPTRAVASPVREVPDVPPPTPSASAAIDALGGCLNLPARRSVTDELGIPAPEGWPGLDDEIAGIYVLDPPGLLAVRTPDVLIERGLLYSRKAYDAGRYRLTVDRRPQVGIRTAAVEVPDFDHVRRAIRGPEEVLMHLLRNEVCPDRDDPRHPLFVHGKTFLEIREFIAQAMFEHYPAYREWARERLVAEATPEIEALLREFDGRQGLTAQSRAAVRATLLERAALPAREAPQRFLAEWLGDIPARDLVQSLESRLGRALLDPLGRGDEVPLAERLERSGFGVLDGWFPPASEVRVLAPLVPAYDVARNVIGFYRVVLPRPRVGAPPADPLPSAPFGLWTTRFLLDTGIWDNQRGDGLRLGAIVHVVPDEAHDRALTQQCRKSGRQGSREGLQSVVLDILDHDIEGAVLELTAVYEGSGGAGAQPTRISGCLVGDASEAMHGLLDRLTAHPAYGQLSCTSRNSADDERLRRDPQLR